MRLLKLLGGCRREVTLLVAASCLLLAAEAFLHPILIMLIFDEGVIQGDFERFLILVSAYLIFGLILNIGHLRISLWAKAVENRLAAETSRRMLRVFYQKDYSSVVSRGEGYFLSRIYNDVVEGLVPLVSLLRDMISKGVMLVVFLAVLFYLSWQATLILLAAIPIAAYLSIRLGKRIRQITTLERENEGSFLSLLNRALSAFKVVRDFRLVPQTVQVYDTSLNEYLDSRYQNHRVATLYRTFSSMAMNVADFLALFVGALFVLRGALTFGGYLAFVNAFWRAVTTMMDLLHPTADLHRLLGIVNRLDDFERKQTTPYYEVQDGVLLSGISFAYDNTPVIEDLSLRVAPGERIIISGPNGSGKTTLANIVAGHLAPQRGECFLPGTISSATLPLAFPPLKVRELVGGDGALLTEFGLGHLLDEPAEELSAGQKQKLGVALALSRDADLYVLDEPLASVDVESRPLVMNAILNRTAGKTLIVIMHGHQEYVPAFDRAVEMGQEVGLRSAAMSRKPALKN